MCGKIKIEKVAAFHCDPHKVQLVVFLLTKPDNTPYHFVWIMGNIDKVRLRLFAAKGQQFERTYFGIRYGAQYPTDNIRIELNTTKLNEVCRDLNITSVVIVRFHIP